MSAIEYHWHFEVNALADWDPASGRSSEACSVDVADCDNGDDAIAAAKRIAPGRPFYKTRRAYQCSHCPAHAAGQEMQLLHLKAMLKMMGGKTK